MYICQSLTTRDSYFPILVEVSTNHILAENTYFTNHVELTEHKSCKISTKLFGYMSQFQKHSYRRFPPSSISLSSKSFVNIIFYGTENNKLQRQETINHSNIYFTAQKMKFSSKDFFSKRDQIRSFLRIWSRLLKKSFMENVIFCAVFTI